MQRFLTRLGLVSCLSLALLHSVTANADVIGYEGLVGLPTVYTESGFETSVSFFYMQPAPGSAGSVGAYPSFAGQTITIRETNNAVFSLMSMDFAVNDFMSFDVVGSLSGGGSVSKRITASVGTPTGKFGQTDFEYFTFNFGAPFSEIVSLSFVQGSFETRTNTTFDNVVVTRVASVPEPGTLALFGLGLAGLGLSRRRKVA